MKSVRKIISLLLLLTVVITNACSQGLGKISPSILNDIDKGNTARQFFITIKGKEAPRELRDIKYKHEKIADYDSIVFYKIETDFATLIEKIIILPEVLFVEDANRKAKEEGMVNNLDLAVNLISTAHNKTPQWNGEGITFSLKENKPDTTDIDFAGRYISTPLTSKIVSQHATTMGTMAAGGGNSWYLGKGAAWAAMMSSSDFANLLPDPISIFQQFNISLQNHSYGVGVESFYGADAAMYDASVNNEVLHIFSSGNSGISSAATGSYAGITGFANLTGSFKMAKNIVTVGATDSFHTVAMQSSKGPAHDGRVKPEIVAFGIDGSSGAAALTSGVALMMQQAYKQQFGQLPENALVKAVLLNSADDRGAAEVDYANGFGSLNALHALRTISTQRFRVGNVTNGNAQLYSIAVPAGIKKLKVTLVWNDLPAAPNATKALINDLDLELINAPSNEKWLPWVLNKFPHIDSLKLPATRKRDSLNNVEQITIDNPAAATYQLNVKGTNVNGATQKFYIAYQFDSSDIFEWHFPLSADPVFPSSLNTLRWKSSFSNSSGRLDYSINNGNTWQTIEPAINLSTGFYNWIAPAFNGRVLLRMQVNNIQFATDTFIMAARTPTGIGFNCPDSFLFYWNKIPEANAYKVYTMGSKYLQPVFTTSIDSFKIFRKSSNPSLYYAVAPMFSNREGVRSYTLNYTLQGVECYVRSFIATLVNTNVAQLRLRLGSIYDINKITLEKKIGDQFIAIDNILNISSFEIDFLDNNLSPGLNTYRVRIDLAGGGIAYTSIETVFYFGDKDYVIYPNPALQSQQINVAQMNSDDAVMQVFNSLGLKVYEMRLTNQINSIPANRLSKGAHFIRISENGKRAKSFKLVVF